MTIFLRPTPLAVIVLLAAAWQPAPAEAQWVGIQHDFAASLSYAFTYADTTLEGDFAITGVPTHSHFLTLSAEYVPLDRLAVRLGMEAYAGKYLGPQSGPNPAITFAHGDYDDGNIHFTTADAFLELAYMALDYPVAVTPLVRLLHPTRDYETSGYAAAGLGLRALGAGVELGVAGLGLHGLFARARYVFMYVESEDAGGELTSNINLHRSEAQYGVGYTLEPRTGIPLAITLGGAFWYTHGGVPLIESATERSPLFPYHDVVRSQRFLTFGGNIAYWLHESVAVTIGAQALVWGDNVAQARTLTAGVTWTDNVLDLMGN